MATTPILPSDFIFFDQVNSTTVLPPGNYAANVSTDIDLGSSFNQTQGNICEPINNPPLIITAGIISMAVIIGNGLVILAIIGGNSRFFRPMYWFIVHLSFSDLLVGLMLLWNYCLAGIFNINNTLTSLSFLFGIWVTSACCSVFGILLLAIDRYMQVVHKALHKLYFNQFTVGLSIFLSWLIPLLGFLVIPISLNLSCKDTCRCIEGKYMECKPVTICSQII
uniref:G-protein coupled receptors family 1 profile domain-containing protein n=1 Tax=Ciona intestinalis TaxID=7719 RepID=F6UV70_CIOIN